MASNDIQSLTADKQIDYITRDFDSTVDSIVNFAQVNFGPGTTSNRLWSNFNAASFSRTWLEMIAYVSDIFFFYFDNQATESYLQTATTRSAVRQIAKQFGFTPATASSASGNVVFTFTGAGTINRGFRVASVNGVNFYLTDAVTAGAAGEFTGTVLQGSIKTQTFTTTGLQNEEFNLEGPNVIIDTTAANTLDRSPIVTVNGNTYSLVETFIRSNGTDTPPVTNTLGEITGGGGRVFQLEERPDGTPYLRFGDGVFGRKLLPGETVTITYRTGGGTQGNLASGTVTTLVDNVSFITAVRNDSDFSGGADEQSIEELRELIPASLRTLERAVSASDYSDLIVSKFSEVSAASTETNDDDPGIDLNVYVVPQGSTITAITENTNLLNRINTFVDARKMVTVQFQILDAFGVQVLMTLEVFIEDTASKTTVESAIRTAITSFFDLNTGGANGSGIGFAEPILLKDITSIISDIDGIQRFEIKRLTYRPRVQQNVQGLVTSYNNSEVDVFPNVGELEWLAASAGQQTETSGTVLFNNDAATSFTYDSSTGKIAYSSPVTLSEVAPGDLFRNGPGLFETVNITTTGDGSGAAEQIKVTTRADEQGIQEVFTVQAAADVSGSLAGTFFVMFDQSGSVGVWFDVGGTTPIPSMGTNRAIKVTISTNDSANTIAGLMQTAIDSDSEFSAVVSGVQQVTQITAAAPADISDAQYFLINSSNDGVKYYVWFDKSGSATDPNVAGRTGIEVDVSAAATDDDVAEAIRVALDGSVSFSATRIDEVVTVTNANNGPATPASNVNVGGAFAVLTLTLGSNADTITVTNAEKLDVFDTVDGSVPTNFTITTTVQGISPNTLGGTYFDIADSSGDVRVWFDVDNTSTAPSTPAGGRLLEVDISANDTGNTVAANLQSVIDGDSEYSASVASSEVTITNASVGLRSGPTDGVPQTSFTFETLIEGADAASIDGNYLVIPDANGGIAFWFDVNDSGTAEPTHNQPRSVEVNSITTGMTDAQVAEELEKAITATAPYTTRLAEQSQVTTIDDVSGSLNNKYFLINAADDATQYYVWYNVSGGGTDPALAGLTGIEVAITTNDNANTVAALTTTAIDLIGDFNATNPSAPNDEILITNTLGGKATNSSDGTSPNGTGFTFETLSQGATISASRVDNVITVTHTDKATLTAPDAGTSGFTIAVAQQGVADDTDFTINSVDTVNSELFLNTSLPVNAVSAVGAGGSIRNGATTFDSYKVYKKILATATNLSIDSITDSSIDLSVNSGTATALSDRVLIDNSQVFVPNELATGEFYLVDGAGNIWEVEANTSNSITTSITAVNDAAISTVSSGNYKIVTKLVGSQIVFNDSIFNVQYNSDNTVFSVGAQFTQIGTLGDQFEISEEQTNQGSLGIAADLITFNIGDGEVRLNGSPDLQGLTSESTLIDSSGQTFNIVGVNNQSLPQLVYDSTNRNDSLTLKGTGVGSQYSQGFQVAEAETYSVISVNMQRQGNATGSMTARIVLDDGTGLPDVAQLVAVSNSVTVSEVSNSAYEDVLFSFTNPPALQTGQQYHLVISGDVIYNNAVQDAVTIFSNSGSVAYTYNVSSGAIEYASSVDLSSVLPGHFFEDDSGDLFQVLSVDDSSDSLLLSSGLSLVVGGNGNIIANDSIIIGVDNLSPTFASGEMSQFDGTVWSNSSTGPNQFTSAHDMIFSISGPKSIKIDSNLTPVLGEGATISKRYYDDENQISVIIGLSAGTITSATDVNAIARGTVGALPDTEVDNFVWRTSRFSDDIINARLSEVLQIASSDLVINVFGGVS